RQLKTKGENKTGSQHPPDKLVRSPDIPIDNGENFIETLHWAVGAVSRAQKRTIAPTANANAQRAPACTTHSALINAQQHALRTLERFTLEPMMSRYPWEQALRSHCRYRLWPGPALLQMLLCPPLSDDHQKISFA